MKSSMLRTVLPVGLAAVVVLGAGVWVVGPRLAGRVRASGTPGAVAAAAGAPTAAPGKAAGGQAPGTAAETPATVGAAEAAGRGRDAATGSPAPAAALTAAHIAGSTALFAQYVDREPSAIRLDRRTSGRNDSDRRDTAAAGNQPGAQQPAGDAVTGTAEVPVLMYHEITQGPNSLYVPPAELAAQLDWLQQHGYVAVTMQQVYDHFTSGATLPDHPVVLTFDDGYASFYTNAVPLLKAHNWPGTVFVITSDVGKPGFLTWDQVRAAARQGMEIGDHTVTHPDLTIIAPSRLSAEVNDSRKVLQDETAEPINFFCYPSGRVNDAVAKAVKESGFLAAVTTKFGLAGGKDNPFLWQRVRVSTGTTPAGLAALLRQAASDH